MEFDRELTEYKLEVIDDFANNGKGPVRMDIIEEIARLRRRVDELENNDSS